MGTIIYIDNQKIKSETQRAEKNLSILNSNYPKVQALGFDYEVCFLASNYQNEKQNLRDILKVKYKADFLPISEVNNRIREIEKHFYYNTSVNN
ncbi:hypothetical protein EZS27_043056 [termite gut metagenome]|uniref:Uncharacterized protein n=1 Tax=termite gut metagenome TaxID=433724 RepID=A0A5J4P7N9_9ZZZZ